MEVFRQTCQNCGSRQTKNFLVRESTHRPLIYVACSDCKKLVARYRLSEYYHHGRGIESYLRSRGSNAAESGRQVLDEFKGIQTDSIDGFEAVLEFLKEHGKEF